MNAKLTLDELARRTGLNYSTCQSIESGRIPGSLTTRQKIADVLNIPLRFLLRDEERRVLEGSRVLRQIQEFEPIPEREIKSLLEKGGATPEGRIVKSWLQVTAGKRRG